MPLRYYQDEACESVQFALEELDRVLLVLGTGAGKTRCAGDLIRRFQPHRCVFIADQDELCQQPLDAIAEVAGIIPGLDKAKHKANLNAKVVVASAQTLAREARLMRYPYKFFKYGIVDEAHRGATRDRLITDHLCQKVIGLTATPFTGTLRDLSSFYEDTAYSLPMLDLIADGFAPPLKVMTLPVEIDLAAVAVRKSFGEKDYNAEDISTTIAPYYAHIIELLKEHAAGRHVIIFLPLIESSKAFAALARQAGVQAMHVDGKSEDRAETIEGFKRGRFQWLCNANVVETGVDIPIADCFVNLRPTRSPVKYQQGVGRILRVLPGVIDDIPGKDQAEERRARIAASAKPDALIIDFLWQHDKLGVMRASNLIARNEEESLGIAEKIKAQRSPEQLAEIARMFQEEKEAQLVKQLERNAGRKASIAPAEFGYLIGSKALQEYEPQAGWQMDAPSPAQIAKLQKWGIDVAQVTSKGQASKLMDAMIHRFKFRLASVGKMETLRKAGIPFDPRTLTDAEALKLIAAAGLRLAKAA